MTLDVLQAQTVAGGETASPLPFVIEGLNVLPSIETLCSQVTGDGITKLYIRLLAGRARIVDFVKDFRTDEYTVVDFTTENRQYDQDSDADGTPDLDLSAGNAVWFAVLAVQHRPNASIEILFVPGAIAAVASAAAPSVAVIEDFIGDNKRFVILGDVLFYRSADTTIQTRVSEVRRPAYVDVLNKTGVINDQGAQSSLSMKFCTYISLNVDLTSISAVADNAAYVDGLLLPNLPYGGALKGWKYIPTVAGAGSSATVTLRLAIDGTNVVDSDITITEALSAIGQSVQDVAFSSAYDFKSGDRLDVEVVSSATNFTAGSGILQIEIWEYVP